MQFYCFTGPKGEKTSISKIAMGCYGMGDEKSPFQSEKALKN